MSCYQVLTLNNNTGDLGISQGNVVNLVTAIQRFSIRTPVVDFKLIGNTLELYYTDAAGNLQVKIVQLPIPAANSAGITVVTTSTIAPTLINGVISSNVRISQVAGNLISINSDGIFANFAQDSLITTDTSSVTFGGTAGHNLTASVVISPDAGNALTLHSNGLYTTGGGAISPSAVRALISGTSPILYDNTTGIVSIQTATTSTNGAVTSTDWNTFNNKISNIVNIGSSIATNLVKDITSSNIAEVYGLLAGNGIGINTSGGNVVISTTATVPVVNAGPPITINTAISGTTATLAGSAAVSFGTISSTQWSLLSGPNVPIITDASSLTSTVTGLAAGTYRLRLEAVASTGLVSTGIVTISVSTGSVTLDTIYIGAKSSSTPPDLSTVIAGTASMQNGALDVAADWTTLTASTPLYCWFAIPAAGAGYFKIKWFENSLNNGNIGGSTDLFGPYTTVTISGVVYEVGITNYPTQFTGIIQLKSS